MYVYIYIYIHIYIYTCIYVYMQYCLSYDLHVNGGYVFRWTTCIASAARGAHSSYVCASNGRGGPAVSRKRS